MAADHTPAHEAAAISLATEPPVGWNAIDREIRPVVRHLRAHGFDTFASCQGGEGHDPGGAYVLFRGDQDAGMRAVWVLEGYGYRIWEMSRCWPFGEHLDQRVPDDLQPYWRVVMRTLEPFEPRQDRDPEGGADGA